MTGSAEPDQVETSDTPTADDLHRALRERALVFDRSARGRVRLTGDKAPELLTGMVSNDVAALAPGGGTYALALTAKGRIVADLRIFRHPDGVLVDAPERAHDGWMAMVRKFVNPRVAPYRDVSAELAHLGVFGATAAETVARACALDAAALNALEPYAHLAGQDHAGAVTVARSPELGVTGFDLFMPVEQVPVIRAELRAAGAGTGTPEGWHVARVEAGRPEWGIDMDESTLPQEANMDTLGAISYTKGCYVGQEVVARIHFRGHVNRHLRGLRFGHPDGAPTGAELVDGDGKVVGDVRSSVHSVTLGAIAIAMVRREIAPDTEVIAKAPHGDVRAAVLVLPFTV